MGHKMMKGLGLLMVIMLVIVGCKTNSEKYLEEAAELYNEGKHEAALKKVEKGLLSATFSEKLGSNELLFTRRVIYQQDGDNLKIYFPLNVTIDDVKGIHIISVEPIKQRIALSNGKVIRLYSREGTFQSQVTPEQKKERIKSIVFIEDAVIYFLGNKLMKYDINREKSESLIKKEIFHPPYKNAPFSAQMSFVQDILFIVTGYTGTYYASFYDLKKNILLMKNLKVATPKMYSDKNIIYALTGMTGLWVFENISLPGKKRKTLHQFSNLTDIHFFDSGFVFEDNKGRWIVDYAKKKAIKLPFSFSIDSSIAGRVLIKDRKTYYLLYMKGLVTMIAQLSGQMPELFPVQENFLKN